MQKSFPKRTNIELLREQVLKTYSILSSVYQTKKLCKELGCEIPSWDNGLKKYVTRLKEKVG